MSARAPSLFVIAAPSGAGKTTLVHALVKKHPANEADGVDYLFIDSETFESLQQQGEMLESATVFDNFYGTSRRQVQQHLDAGHSVIVEIDWQGARQVREAMPDCISIFILPPSHAELVRRLTGRGTESEAVIQRRLRDALSDMAHWEEFDYVVINDRLDTAVAELEAIVAGRGEANATQNERVRRAIARIGA